MRLLSRGTWEFQLDEGFLHLPLGNTCIILLLKWEEGFLLDSHGKIQAYRLVFVSVSISWHFATRANDYWMNKLQNH